MADNPQNPGAIPFKELPPELQKSVEAMFKKHGVLLEKSYSDAYKKVTRIAEIFERNIQRQQDVRHRQSVINIGKEFREKIANAKKSEDAERRLAVVRDQLLKRLYDNEKRYVREVEESRKKLSRPSYGALMGREMGSLPLVGNMLSTTMSGGWAGVGALASMGAVGMIGTLVTKFISDLFKTNIASTQMGVALTKTGMGGSSLAGAFSGIPRALAGQEDFGKWAGQSAVSRKAIEDLKGGGFGNYLGHMGLVGKSLDDSVEEFAKAELSWGGSFTDLNKQFYRSRGLIKETGYGFDTLFNTMQDLDPVMKNLSFSSEAAGKASADFTASWMKRLASMGMAPDQARAATVALGGFVGGMSAQTKLGLASFLGGDALKHPDAFFKDLAAHPEKVTELWEKSVQKITGYFPKGQASLGILGQAGKTLPAEVATNPALLNAFIKYQESGGYDTEAKKAIADFSVSQKQEAADRIKGFAVLANLNDPLSNLSKYLDSILQELSQKLVPWVGNINDMISRFPGMRSNPLNPYDNLPMTSQEVSGRRAAEEQVSHNVADRLARNNAERLLKRLHLRK